jgi:protease IV
MRKRRFLLIFLLMAATLMSSGCTGLKVNIGAGAGEPLKEFTLEGKERGKVLVISVRGFLSDAPRRSLLGERASMVQEVVAQLRLAEKDENIKALLLEINSPGGSITASDILYHEIM